MSMWARIGRNDAGDACVLPAAVTPPRADREVYAVGCWWAVERLVERLERGRAALDARATPRAVTHWLRLAFRATALIARMGAASSRVSAAFPLTATAARLDALAWPDAPEGVDLDAFVVRPARWIGGAPCRS